MEAAQDYAELKVLPTIMQEYSRSLLEEGDHKSVGRQYKILFAAYEILMASRHEDDIPSITKLIARADAPTIQKAPRAFSR